MPTTATNPITAMRFIASPPKNRILFKLLDDRSGGPMFKEANNIARI
jgi:hypothetical protein